MFASLVIRLLGELCDCVRDQGKGWSMGQTQAVIHRVLCPLADGTQQASNSVALSDAGVQLLGGTGLAALMKSVFSACSLPLLAVCCDWAGCWEGRKLKPLEHSLFLMS